LDPEKVASFSSLYLCISDTSRVNTLSFFTLPDSEETTSVE
jgi:hypothetical protein